MADPNPVTSRPPALGPDSEGPYFFRPLNISKPAGPEARFSMKCRPFWADTPSTFVGAQTPRPSLTPFFGRASKPLGFKWFVWFAWGPDVPWRTPEVAHRPRVALRDLPGWSQSPGDGPRKQYLSTHILSVMLGTSCFLRFCDRPSYRHRYFTDVLRHKDSFSTLFGFLRSRMSLPLEHKGGVWAKFQPGP